MRQFFTAALLAGGATLALSIGADAHSLVRLSDPPDGATLAHAPSLVIITFTEAPDPKLSQIQILDTSGREVAGGPASAVSGAPTTVAITLPPLGDGVYTVSWRTVSAIDGHVATGVFAFAVGAQPVPPIPLALAQPAAPPSPLGVIGRWGLDAGYGLLLGGAWVDLLALQDFSLAVLLVVGVGDLLALIGAFMVAEAARENAGVDWSLFLGTSLAHGMEFVVLPIILAGLAVLAAWRLRRTPRRLALAICAGLVVVAFYVMAPVTASNRLPTADAIPLAFAGVLIGLFTTVNRRRALTQILGFLMLENSVFMVALLATYGVPLIVEIGVFLDVLVAVLILEVFVYRIREHFESIDVKHLGSLRG